jgi:hypothetical protein
MRAMVLESMGAPLAERSLPITEPSPEQVVEPPLSTLGDEGACGPVDVVSAVMKERAEIQPGRTMLRLGRLHPMGIHRAAAQRFA